MNPWLAHQEIWQLGAKQEHVPLDVSSIAKFYQFLIRAVETAGLHIHKESRLKKYEILTASRSSRAELNADQILELSFAYNDLMQLAVIVFYGQLGSAIQEHKDKVRQLLCDAANPLTTQKAETPGRDSQFELFLASCWAPISEYCSLSSPPDPDVLLRLNGYDFGVEAKRIKSWSKIGNRFDKAKKQLKTTKDGGIIAMEVSTVLRNARYGHFAKSPNHAVADLERRLKDLMFNNICLAKRKGQSSKSFAWVCFAQALYVVEDIGLMSVYQWKNVNLCDENDCRWLTLASSFPFLVSVMETAFRNINPTA